jgi:hypothetical protein
MADITMHIDAPFAVQTLAVDNGEQFMTLKAENGDVALILPGRDYVAAAHARTIAERLIEAADALEDGLDAAREQVEAREACASCEGDGFGPNYVGNCPRCGGGGKVDARAQVETPSHE